MLLKSIGKLMQSFIEEKEFFLYPYKKIENIFDILLHKQLWFHNFFIDFLDGHTFLKSSNEYRKSVIYNQYRTIKEKNKFKKLFFYKVIVLEEENPDSLLDSLEPLYDWLKEEKIKIRLFFLHIPSKKIFSLFSNFEDPENIEEFLIEQTKLPIDIEEEINLLSIEQQTKKNKGYYLEPKKPYITKLLIAINIIFFAYMSIMGSTTNISDLIHYGAKYNPLVASGEYYRLISSMFIHIGLVHLLFNTYALNMLGKDIEVIYGPTKFIWIYFIAGIFGSLGSFLFSSAVSAGASGALFGLMGAFLYFGIKRPAIFSVRYGMNIVTLLIMNIVFGLLNQNIDNFAHLGGLLGGLLASFCVGIKDEKWFTKKHLAIQILTLVLIVVLLFTGVHIHQNSWEYNLHTGVKYLQEEDYIHAKRHFEKGIEKNENISEFYFYLAYIYYHEENLDLTITNLEKTLSLDPNHRAAKKFLDSIK